MENKKCIICKEIKNKNLFSEEHIIPDSLGGTIKILEVCKKCIIDDFSNKADKAIRRGDIEKAKYIIAKIERVDSESPEINILNMKIENFKSAK